MKVWAAIAYNASLCMSATMVIRRFCECCNKHPLRIRIEIVETLQTFDWNEPVLPMQPGQGDQRVSPAERARQFGKLLDTIHARVP